MDEYGFIFSVDPTELEAAQQDASNPLRFKQQVIYARKEPFRKFDANGRLLLEFTVNEQDIDHWVSVTDEMIKAGIDIPMPLGHTTDADRRRASALKFEKATDSKGRPALYVLGEYKDEQAKRDLKDSKLSLWQPPKHKQSEHTFKRPIRHVAFTDYPVVHDLEKAIAASTIILELEEEKKRDMSLASLAKKLGLEVKEDATDDALTSAISKSFTTMQSQIKDLTGKLSKFEKKSDDDDKKEKSVAASQDPDPRLVKLVRDNRSTAIENLTNTGKLKPHQAEKLKKQFCGEELKLSDAEDLAWDTALELAQSNDENVMLSNDRQTGSQRSVKPEDSLLVKDAKRRSGN